MKMKTAVFTDKMILVRGGGDLATGVIHKLHQSGYQILILECDRPSAIRRHVAFCEAVYDGTAEVEGVVCRRSRRMISGPVQEMLGTGRDPTSDRYRWKTYPRTGAGGSDRCHPCKKESWDQQGQWLH